MNTNEYKIIVPLDEVQPDWVRKLICIVYYPIVTPIILIAAIFCSMFGKYTIKDNIVYAWKHFYVKCWKGY